MSPIVSVLIVSAIIICVISSCILFTYDNSNTNKKRSDTDRVQDQVSKDPLYSLPCDEFYAKLDEMYDDKTVREGGDWPYEIDMDFFGRIDNSLLSYEIDMLVEKYNATDNIIPFNTIHKTSHAFIDMEEKELLCPTPSLYDAVDAFNDHKDDPLMCKILHFTLEKERNKKIEKPVSIDPKPSNIQISNRDEECLNRKTEKRNALISYMMNHGEYRACGVDEEEDTDWDKILKLIPYGERYAPDRELPGLLLCTSPELDIIKINNSRNVDVNDINVQEIVTIENLEYQYGDFEYISCIYMGENIHPSGVDKYVEKKLREGWMFNRRFRYQNEGVTAGNSDYTCFRIVELHMMRPALGDDRYKRSPLWTVAEQNHHIDYQLGLVKSGGKTNHYSDPCLCTSCTKLWNYGVVSDGPIYVHRNLDRDYRVGDCVVQKKNVFDYKTVNGLQRDARRKSDLGRGSDAMRSINKAHSCAMDKKSERSDLTYYHHHPELRAQFYKQ